MKQDDDRKDCCKDEKNLGPVEPQGKDLTFRRCQVCKCRHFVLDLDPMRIGMRGARI